MTDTPSRNAEDGWFEDGSDRGRIVASSRDTDGRYGVMEWIVAGGEKLPPDAPRAYGAHLHGACEESFLITKGSLEFLIGEEMVTLEAGDLVRVPPGIRHGYANVSGAEVEMVVTFMPGGLEELFVKYRTDQDGAPQGDGFIADATRLFASAFEEH